MKDENKFTFKVNYILRLPSIHTSQKKIENYFEENRTKEIGEMTCVFVLCFSSYLNLSPTNKLFLVFSKKMIHESKFVIESS